VQVGIRCMLIRGGTSKGAYFLADDLPSDVTARDRMLLALMGSPDKRQVDGLGGAHPLTSKVAIISKSNLAGCDIDFLFAQVDVNEPRVDTTPNCGNILAGVGPFALARGLVKANGAHTTIRVRTLNTGTIADLALETEGGLARNSGLARIDGVPGSSAPIQISFRDTEGSVCGALLPTGNRVDIVDGVAVTLIDNGMPVIVLRAADVGRTGHESRDVLDNDIALKARLERIRLAAGPLMNLGDVSQKVIPKIALVGAPQAGGTLSTRSFIPHECHASIGVFAAVTVATAAVLPGSSVANFVTTDCVCERNISVEHPTGEFTVSLTIGGTPDKPIIERAGLLRTARILMDGTAFVPETVMNATALHHRTQ
jgi:4-oxalomesaconate tautomerase